MINFNSNLLNQRFIKMITKFGIILFVVASVIMIALNYSKLNFFQLTSKEEKNESTAKLVYRIGKSANENLAGVCDERIEIIEKPGAKPKKLLENCFNEIHKFNIIGWIDNNTLLFREEMNKNFYEFDITEKKLKPFRIAPLPNFNSTLGTSILQLVKEESDLFFELLQRNWGNADIRMVDQFITILTVDGVYGYDRTDKFHRPNKKLVKLYTFNKDDFFWTAGLVNEREMALFQLKTRPENELKKRSTFELTLVDLYGFKQKKLTDKITPSHILFGDNFLLSLPVKYETLSQISVFDVLSQKITEIPIEGVAEIDSNEYTAKVEILNFSNDKQKIAYTFNTVTRGRDGRGQVVDKKFNCKLYSFDIKTGKNILLTEGCFIGDVIFSPIMNKNGVKKETVFENSLPESQTKVLSQVEDTKKTEVNRYSWEKFSSTLGFTLNYPKKDVEILCGDKNKQLTTLPQQCGALLLIKSGSKRLDYGPSGTNYETDVMTMTIQSNPDSLPLREWHKKLYQSVSSELVVSGWTDKKIDGREAIFQTSEFKQNWSSLGQKLPVPFYDKSKGWIIKLSNIKVISVGIGMNHSDGMTQLYEAILSTIKFN